MIERPKVSVIVPCYNVAEYLPRCLDSLVGQTLRDIEIICIDDGSTDNSLDILKQYAKKDKRIVVIHQKNSGVAAARNAGIDAAHGEYIGFVDPDDYVDLDFYEKLYKSATSNDADIARANVKQYELNKTVKESDLINSIIKNGKWYFRYEFWSAIYKKCMLDINNIRFVPDLINGEDILFLAQCVAASNTLNICPQAYYNYIRRKGSLDAKILPANHILSKLTSTNILCKLYNSSEIPDKEYIYAYTARFLYLFSLLNRNGSLAIKQKIVEAMVEVYKLCKQQSTLLYELGKSGKFDKKMLKYIQSENAVGLLKYILRKTPRKFKGYLLSFIPIFWR